ncbi:MAG: DUF1847 domain-containing protein [Alphaproteobacteria bacterium]|nr:DUF1847 domain-containing protein [Alphaproteobacteria bacterium]
MIQYNQADIETMIISAQARDKSRLQELIRFAHLSGYKKIGIANCAGVQKYAENLMRILVSEGFEVFSINCKQSGLKGEELSTELNGPSCDPVSQAEYLSQCKTDINIEVGLCLGHGLLFSKHSQAPVTTFLVKDFSTEHKTVECLG